jgi:hypothetical protein
MTTFLIAHTWLTTIPMLVRSCSTNDWTANTLGSVLGGLLTVVALAVGRRSPVRVRMPPVASSTVRKTAISHPSGSGTCPP